MMNSKSKKRKKSQPKKLMRGKLWFVDTYDDEIYPEKLSEFKESRIREMGFARILEHGSIVKNAISGIPTLIFDMVETADNDPCSFKLFLYKDHIALGVIEYPAYLDLQKEYFKGNFKKVSKSHIIVGGQWADDLDYKIKYYVYFELSLRFKQGARKILFPPPSLASRK